ncbi:hypothetical protein ACIQYM_39350 [Rhodococcus erythropolis]
MDSNMARAVAPGSEFCVIVEMLTWGAFFKVCGGSAFNTIA